METYLATPPTRGTDGDTPSKEDPDAALLQEIRDYFDYDTDNWAAIRAEAAIDVAYAANDTWRAEDKLARAGRPMLNLDQLSQYRNQVENTVRQNKRGVKVSQAGGGATDQTAELRANRIREIEYQSHAQEAYSQAFSDCLTRSYGFARIIAEYEDEATDNQVLRTKAIPNPNQVLPDSDAESTSGRDWMRCFFVHSISHREFHRDYPGATFKNFDAALIARAPKWLSDKRVQIAEYWKVTETPNPRGKGRPTREVCQYLTNGIELLAKPGQPKKTIWKGKYIPFAACYGRIVYKDTGNGETEKLMLSYIRFARDSAKAYNWTKSTLLEKIALPVRASLIGYDGQATPETLDDVERATQEPVAWLGFKAQTEATGQAVLPLPQYGTREPDIQADLLAADGFQRDIQNALGHYNTQDARLGNNKVTSGVALAELKRSGDLGSFDFLDHYDDFQKFMGEQYDDLLQYYDDTDKEVVTRLADGTSKVQRINHPSQVAPDGTTTYGPDDVRMDQGRHTITISTGPNFDSQREAGKEAAMTLLGNPQAFPIIAADAIRLMDLGPIGDQMAEDLEFLQPPQMQQARQQAKQGPGAEPDPKQLQQELGALKEQLQACEAALQEAQQAVETKRAEQEAKLQIAQVELQSKDQNADADRQLKAHQSEGELVLKAELAQVELELKKEALALERDALQLKVHELEMKERMHQEDLASAERIAEMNNAAKVDAAEKAAKVAKTIAFHKDAEGNTTGAEITARDEGAE